MENMFGLTKSEEILLLCIWRLKKDAYGVRIRKYLKDTLNNEITYGTLYSYLDQLVKKEYVLKEEGDPTPERGGRRKIFYTVSQKGLDALKESQELQKTIWDGIEDFILTKK